jgi:cell division septation protein DedD
MAPVELAKPAAKPEAVAAAPKPEPLSAEPLPAPAAKGEPAAPAEPPKPRLDDAFAKVASPAAEPVPTRTRDAGLLKDAIARAQKPTEAAADGAWTLQIAAYQDKAEADRMTSTLRDKGYAPFVVEAQVPNKGLWYRVRMGRFPTKDAAGRYLADFKRETAISAIVTNAN